MRSFWVLSLVGVGVGCATIADLRDDPSLVQGGGGAVGGTDASGPCDPLDLTACGGSDKCTVIDQSTGEVSCEQGGTQGAYEVPGR